ncbi:dihydropteroate synthase [Moraxella bovis]|uniref:dihydropteroate synthase n=1 Tax=Moraxella bovis TaxID=476 RepID=UPI0022276357|nr:dihydropteroate synthase [Moraxella bovis]UYZ67564.1 dihydropteroate synthase [Moraxella bovis]UYZ69924.1 dihydropteroate synthase [Moraxella bovis]UYZ74157.1 dihydropteroate synthase [Moraxella bovis]UZA13207.1 dihydropteroate synthase [Moraxella bovis]UZA28453.1 dihydropteroate synthase [Moraxella bovis]
MTDFNQTQNPLFAPLPNFALSANGKILNLSKPRIMGILNVTPDSFSDGGQFTATHIALARVDEMIQQGVDIIDIGAESTRPNATPVTDDLELARLTPIVREIKKTYPNLWLSIDTSSPAVMAQMADLGADIWNDVRGLQRAGACDMASRLALPVVLMHSRGEPATMDKMAVYDDVVAEVSAELGGLLARALAGGVKRENIVLDVGMGFAKKYSHHLEIAKNFGEFNKLGYPMLFGVSRKRFVGEILGQSGIETLQNTTPTERDIASTALALFAVAQGAGIVRTHNVAQVAQSLAVWYELSDKIDD